MDIAELQSYDLDDAVKFNDRLNPRLWGRDEHLLPQVRERLLEIAEDFREFLGIDVEIKDITVSGSNAAYTYTPHSDIDLHLVVDLPRADENEVYRELFDAKKYAYNDQHDFKIGGHDVELYVQDANKPHHSQGIYSLMDNDWIRVPSRRKPKIDDISVRSKYEDLGQRIEAAIDSGDLGRMDAMTTKIRNLRQAGLDQHGEFGPENLAFKILRTNGTLTRLKDARKSARDREMSLDERAGKKQKTRYAYGSYWFPGYDYYGAGQSENPESVEESATPAVQIDIKALASKFVDFVSQRLELEHIPKIRLKKDPAWSRRHATFGRFDPDTNTLAISIADRHPMDVLRTMAHELVHHRQKEKDHMPDHAGETGSQWENEANALAGVLMREFGTMHPDLFKNSTLSEVDSEQQPQPGDPIDYPEGTVHVKVSDVYDWYKIGQKISDLSRANPQEFGQGVPETILVFNNEPQEERMLDQLAKLGLSVHDVDPGEQPGQEVDESLRGKLGAAAAAACIAGTPGCATTGADALRTVQTIGRTAQTLKGMKADDAREELTTAVKDALRKGSGTRESIQTPVSKDDRAKEDYYRFIMGKAAAGRPLSRQEQEFVKTYRLYQAARKQVAEASGYIPTEREKNDPRFSMALTVDIKPGQTGKEANKLGLETDSQGRPALLMKRLKNLLESIKAGRDKGAGTVKKKEFVWSDYHYLPMESIMDLAEHHFLIEKSEEENLLEVKMSPGELQKWAQSEEAQGIQAGFEAELIFRDTARDSDEESEPDMDADERAYSVQQVRDFFEGGDNGIGSGTANRLESGLYEEYYEWANETVDSEWNERERDLVREWIMENVSMDDYRERAAEDLGIDTSEESAENSEAIDQRVKELIDDDIETAVDERNDTWQSAYDEFSDERRDESDLDEESFFRDRYRYMSDVGDAFSLDWPYWTEGGYGEGRTNEDIANSLSSALGGAEVRAGSGYHGVSRKPGRWIVEPDGSLDPDDYEDAGLEVVSPPMPLPDTLRALRTVIDWANSEDGNAYTNGSTGLHMGVSIPHKGGDVDYVKLIMFLGDRYVLDQFGRAANSYTRSALDKLKDVQRNRRSTNEAQGAPMSGAEKTAAAMDLMRKNLIELAQRYVQDGVGKDKYTSAHIKPGYIEFRSPGGDYLSMDSRDESALATTMLRFARAMYIAGRPDLERKEYAKKLYQLIDSQGDDALRLFMDYTTGKINQEELKKDWARRVLAKEQPKKAEQEYEVYDKDTGETLETMRFARGEHEGMVSAAVADAIEKYSGLGVNIGLRKPQEPEADISRRAKVAKKIAERPTIYRVTAGDKDILVKARDTEEAKQRARDRDDYFDRNRSYLSVRPATAEEVKQYQAQAQDTAQDSDDVEQRVSGPSQERRYIVQWTEQRNGREVSDSLGVTARNADAAMDQVRSALEAQGRRPIMIQADQAAISGSTLDRAQQRAQQATAASQREYQIYSRETNNPVVGFMAATDEEAMERLARYRQENPGFEVGVRTGGQSMRAQTPPTGEWTGHWIVKDAQGRELTRFHGIGNNQSDANRHAARWLGTNRPDLAGQEIEVVPEMR